MTKGKINSSDFQTEVFCLSCINNLFTKLAVFSVGFFIAILRGVEM